MADEVLVYHIGTLFTSWEYYAALQERRSLSNLTLFDSNCGSNRHVCRFRMSSDNPSPPLCSSPTSHLLPRPLPHPHSAISRMFHQLGRLADQERDGIAYLYQLVQERLHFLEEINLGPIAAKKITKARKKERYRSLHENNKMYYRSLWES